MRCSCETTFDPTQVKVIEEFETSDPEEAQSLRRCVKCSRRWFHVLYENAAFSRSGHWFVALLPDEAVAPTSALPAEEIELLFNKSQVAFQGGSYFDNKISAASGSPKRRI